MDPIRSAVSAVYTRPIVSRPPPAEAAAASTLGAARPARDVYEPSRVAPAAREQLAALSIYQHAFSTLGAVDEVLAGFGV